MNFSSSPSNHILALPSFTGGSAIQYSKLTSLLSPTTTSNVTRSKGANPTM